jgi:hypothetical protein
MKETLIKSWWLIPAFLNIGAMFASILFDVRFPKPLQIFFLLCGVIAIGGWAYQRKKGKSANSDKS